jgi:hypothetical protein
MLKKGRSAPPGTKPLLRNISAVVVVAVAGNKRDGIFPYFVNQPMLSDDAARPDLRLGDPVSGSGLPIPFRGLWMHSSISRSMRT